MRISTHSIYQRGIQPITDRQVSLSKAVSYTHLDVYKRQGW